MRLRVLRVAACLALMLVSAPVAASTYNLLLETDADRSDGSEVFLASYAGFGDVVSDTKSGAAFSALNIGAGYSVGGLTFDGSYRLLLESDLDRSDGAEVFLASYATFGDILTDTKSGSAFSALNVGADYSIRGLAFDGLYRVLLETNLDRSDGSEIFLASYASFADLLTDTKIGSAFSFLNIGSDYSVGGFTFDGAYRLLLESNADRSDGTEVFLATYASFADLLSDTKSGSTFSLLNVGADYSIRGFTSDYLPTHGDPLSPVPLPASGVLLLAALVGLGARRWRATVRS